MLDWYLWSLMCVIPMLCSILQVVISQHMWSGLKILVKAPGEGPGIGSECLLVFVLLFAASADRLVEIVVVLVLPGTASRKSSSPFPGKLKPSPVSFVL